MSKRWNISTIDEGSIDDCRATRSITPHTAIAAVIAAIVPNATGSLCKNGLMIR
jgi:hypothetical protein